MPLPAPLAPNDVGLILSYQCQAECAHCLYNCASQRNAWISSEDLTHALQVLASLHPPIQVHLTGGEPFLRFPLLLEATQQAVGLGLRVYVETNAGWCISQELTHRQMSQLRRAGMEAILISISPFHAERIPLERTWLAIEIAETVFGRGRVMVYQDQWRAPLQDLAGGGKLHLSAWEQAFGQEQTGRLLWDGYGLIPGGRSGYRLGYLRQGLPVEAFEHLTCQQDILFAPHSHFDLHGDYIPGFCGGLSLGSWKEFDQLQASAREGDYPSLVRYLIDGGPFYLFKMAQADYSYKSRSEGYVGKCHLCVDVRRHLKTQDEFPDLAPSEFYDYF